MLLEEIDNKIVSGCIKPRMFCLGFINNLVYVAIFSFGCIMTDFRCSGDVMGGIMMVYAIGLFVPQLVIAGKVFLYFVSFSRRYLFPNKYGGLSTRDKKYLNMYYASLVLVVLFSMI